MDCPRCHASNRGGARFCDSCGAPLGLARETEAPLDSERKHISVLFADICGSTRLISGRDPEQAWALLDPILQTMVDAVEEFGGTVNQILGDGIMALIGAPVAQEDHAVRACYAAIRMHEAIAQAFAAPEVRIHIGIGSGHALVGTTGSDLNRAYKGVGEIIHIAARLQEMAAPGQTLCMAETLREAEGFVAGRLLGSRELRGIGDAVGIGELLGVAGATTRFQASAARGLTPLVGRERELASLRRMLDAAQEAGGPVVALVGDAGVGKSRLVWELRQSPQAALWQVLDTGGVFYAAHTPYHPIARLLRTRFGIGEADEKREAAERVSAALRAIGAEAHVAAMLSLIGLDPEDADWVAADPLRRRAAMIGAFDAWVRAEAARTPLLLVVEDLHWVDSETHALLDGLPDRLPAVPLVVLVSYRPDHDPRWTSQSRLITMPLSPLLETSTAQLAEAILGADLAVKSIVPELVRRTAGNPFFLEETIRALAESTLLDGSPGAFTVGRGWWEAQIPPSVQAVLAARIDRLPPFDKRLLQAASVLGPRFPLRLLPDLLDDAPEGNVQQGLRRLCEGNLLQESGPDSEPGYCFTHALTQEVAYETLPQARRRALHATVVHVLETTHADRWAEHVDTLAFHAARGEVWRKLVTYARQAGRRAAAQSAYRESIRHFEQVLTGFEHLPQTDAVIEDIIETRFEMRNALFPLGEIGRDLEQLGIAQELAAKLPGQRKLAWVSAYLARDLALLGQPEASLEACRRAAELSGRIDDPDLVTLVQSYIGQAHYVLGDYAESAAVMGRLVVESAADPIERRYGLPLPGSIAFRCWTIWPLARMGRATEAGALSAELGSLTQRVEQPLGQTVAQYSRGFAAVHAEEFAQAILLLEVSLELCRRWGFSAWFTNIASSLGYAYARSGRLREGEDLLRQAVSRSRALGLWVSHAAEVAWLAEACAIGGRAEEAAELAAQALAIARRHGERGNEAYALCIGAEIAMQAGTLPDSEVATQLELSRHLAEACGMAPLLARCVRAQGQLEATATVVEAL